MALIYYVTHIQFEFGATALLRQECERIGITRPLIVTDQGIKAAGLLSKVLDAMPMMEKAIYDQTPSNPTESAVGAASASSLNCVTARSIPRVRDNRRHKARALR